MLAVGPMAPGAWLPYSLNSMLPRVAARPSLVALVALTAALLNGTARAAASTPPPPPLISITNPQSNATEQGHTLQLSIHFSGNSDAATLQARLNGADITKLFNPPGTCGSSGGCDKNATVTDTQLLNGDNVLAASVTGPNQSVGTARKKFQYSVAGFTTGTIKRLVPAVAVESVRLEPWTEEASKNINNYQIIVGEGPGFPRKVYTPGGLNCSAGINSVQVLVLGRKTLEPEQAVGGNSHTGQQCFGDAASLDTFLKALPAGDLVIANSFLGLMPKLNTTAIGGTDFSANGQPQPYAYSVVGVVGAPPGTAYESYDPVNHSSIWDLRPLVGSLMLAVGQEYFFVPSDYREFHVIPNDPAFPGNRTSTFKMDIGNTVFNGTLPANASGGFLLVVIDRMIGFTVDATVYPTNSSNPAESAKAMQDLGWVLTRFSSPYHYTILTTIGVPFASSTQPSVDLFNAVNSVGGNGYMLQKLVSSGGGNPPAYTLIGSRDPVAGVGDFRVESSSLWSAQKQTGEISGFFKRDRKNRWTIGQAVSDVPESRGAIPFSEQWEQVAFRHPVDWPAWTPAQQHAYQDLSSAAHYPTLIRDLGCDQTKGCQPIRSYYDGLVASTGGSAPPVERIIWDHVPYYPNNDYTEQDFRVVTNQLATEAAYLRNVYALYGLFRQVTSEEKDNLQAQLSTVASNIESSISVGHDTAISPDRLSKASAATAVLSLLPGIGPGFGAMSAVLGAAAAFVPAPNAGGDVPGGYAVTLDELAKKNQTFGSTLATSTDILFTAIVNDWGKLEIIGSGYGSGQSPWYMCPTCEDHAAPREALPAIALGAKRAFYEKLLGKVFVLDAYLQRGQANPTQVGIDLQVKNWGWANECINYYYNSPPDSWIMYPSFNPAVNNAQDMFIITQAAKLRDNTAFREVKLQFPSQALLDDLFKAPGITKDLNRRLTGGAGFIKDQFYTSNWSSDPTPHDVLLLRPAEKLGGKPYCAEVCMSYSCVIPQPK